MLRIRSEGRVTLSRGLDELEPPEPTERVPIGAPLLGDALPAGRYGAGKRTRELPLPDERRSMMAPVERAPSALREPEAEDPAVGTRTEPLLAPEGVDEELEEEPTGALLTPRRP